MVTRLAGVLILCLAMALEASAHCPVVVRRFVAAPVVTTFVAPVVKTVVAETIAVAVPVPVAVQVPVYSAVYGGPPQLGPVGPPPPAAPDCNQLMREVQQLRAEVQALRGGGAGPGAAPGPEKQAAPLGGLAVLNRCAQCHSGEAPKGGFKMFSSPGQLAS